MSKIDEKSLTKLYYSIGEVAKMFDVNTSLVRFWEKEFPGFSPKKSKSGNRLFTPKDIRNFNRIYQMVKENGYTLEGAKKAMKSKDERLKNVEFNHEALISSLETLKNKLVSLRGLK